MKGLVIMCIFIIWIICLSVSLINTRQNNKYLRIIELVLMTYIMACNNKAIDEMNLYQAYNEIIDGSFQMFDITNFAFTNILMTIGVKLGMSFGIFNFSILLPTFYLIEKSLKRILGNPSMVYFLFSLTSIMLDTTLIRQFIASAFVIYGLQYILQDDYSIKKYIICIILATIIHFSMIVFIVMIVIRWKINKKQKKYIIWFIVIGFLVLSWLNNKQVFGLQFILSLFDSNKLKNYSIASGVNHGWMYSLFIWILMEIVGGDVSKKARFFMSSKDINIIKNIKLMINLSLLFVPFSMMTMVYSRVLRPVSWLVFMDIALWYKYRVGWKSKNRKLKFFILCCVFLVCYSVIFNHVIFSYKATVEPVLRGIPFWDDNYSKMPWVDM